MPMFRSFPRSVASESLGAVPQEKYFFAAAAAKSLQLCPTLCDPIDGSPPGSAIPGILQARTGVEHTCELPCLLNLPPTHLECSASFFPLYPPCVGPTCKPATLWTTIKKLVFDAGVLTTLVFYFASEKHFELLAFIKPVFLGSASIYILFFS